MNTPLGSLWQSVPVFTVAFLLSSPLAALRALWLRLCFGSEAPSGRLSFTLRAGWLSYGNATRSVGLACLFHVHHYDSGHQWVYGFPSLWVCAAGNGNPGNLHLGCNAKHTPKLPRALWSVESFRFWLTYRLPQVLPALVESVISSRATPEQAEKDAYDSATELVGEAVESYRFPFGSAARKMQLDAFDALLSRYYGHALTGPSSWEQEGADMEDAGSYYPESASRGYREDFHADLGVS